MEQEILPTDASSHRSLCFANLTYFLTGFVIIWGALVRATHSGAGCGKHWPMCNGEIVPLLPSIETVIEFTHRTTSGLSALLVFLLWFCIGRRSSSRILKNATLAGLCFMAVEVSIGASLVLFGWVKNDTSGIRALVIALHLINSFLLLGSLHVVAMFCRSNGENRLFSGSKENIAAIILFLLTGSFGAVTALGDTLFPATSIAAGLQQDLSLNSHFLLQLRVLHPIIACFATFFLVRFALNVLESKVDSVGATSLLVAIFLQVAIGVFTITFLAPIYLQLLHLVSAMVVWHFLVRLTAATPRRM